MRGSWAVVGALALVAAGCGDAPSGRRAGKVEPVARPTAVPAAEGVVTTTRGVVVSDDGSGPQLCFGGISFGDPPSCSSAAVAGWDWSAVDDVTEQGGQRWGTYTLTGTFDGSTFEVTDVSAPPGPEPYSFTIPCPTPDGGWQVLDPARTSQDDLGAASNVASGLDDFAMAAVSTPDGRPGPRDPATTVFSVYVAGDPAAAEAAVREVWGGMLCVTQVEHSHAELETVQHALLDVPGMTEVGSGNLDNQVDLEVFSDDGSIQRWVDQEHGEGVVVVESNLQPAG